MKNAETVKSIREKEHHKSKTEKAIYRPDTIPVYMITKPPLLPTEDCYDSDECDYQNKKSTLPSWSTGKTKLKFH